ncbi:hypothetical protein [Candidatus Nitrotoga sp. BS]|uniref:hypothetical protein n=1 Tax=Candidatus Nitrotoga sp. BS TaxID=2890408 RepID=UPI001EF2F440|nr:hypothetical protein [Candidatus Nitrotoga sp. BS]
MKFLYFLLRRPGNRVFTPVVDALVHTAGMAFALNLLRGIQAAMCCRKYAQDQPLIPHSLAYAPIMQLTICRKTLQSP